LSMKSLEEISQDGCLSSTTLKSIEEQILAAGNFTQERVRAQIEWFCHDLSLNRYYFSTTPPELIAKHIESLRAAQILATNSGQDLDLQLASEQPNQAIYLIAAVPEAIEEVERRIELKYPMGRLQSYRTKGKGEDTSFRLYFVTTPHFAPLKADEELTFEKAGDQEFIDRSPASTLERYRAAWQKVHKTEAPCIGITEADNETRIMVALKRDASRRFLHEFSQVLDTYDLHTSRKYVEPFADGKIAFSFYLARINDQELLKGLKRDLSAAVIMPSSKISNLFFQRSFSAQETLYAIAVANFANQFLTSDSEEFQSIARALEGKPEMKGLLGKMKTKLVKDTYTPSRISETILKFPDLVLLAFRQFRIWLSPESVPGDAEAISTEIRQRIASVVSWEVERRIMESFLTFNRVVLKTNFFKADKACLAFRLDSALLDPIDYPGRPFGVFYLIGKEFRGFHVRFEDVARGGIRLVKSRSEEVYDLNSDLIFDENYNLAATQQLKNKDIPEGGSKGTILLHLDSQDKAESAFRHYVDGLLDLLMVPSAEITDRYGQEEILFLGPDEGTAELMNWACRWARQRGFRYWKPFTTGKSPALGGVPHDDHGMTTRSIHEYVLGVLNELGLKEEDVTKVQTGGPDGDLGSNEIKISKDRTIAVVDGSGVVYDPAGLNRDELLRLAGRREMVRFFNVGRLSPQGFLVTVEDRDLTLPNGARVLNGEDFRNRFHLLPFVQADLFVPCGGRPRSINIGNWTQMLDDRGRPRFRAIVEGANLFITQDARLRLEEAGILIIKDASANKGGVTSSSLEVLASLALNDQEYETLMMVSKEGEPPFRTRYIEQIIQKIRTNARLEFLAIKREHKQSGVSRTLLSDQLSLKINNLAAAILNSDLCSDRKLVSVVVRDYCPDVLVERLGVETILERVPTSYIAALVAKNLASTYVYLNGLQAAEVDFLKFIQQIHKGGFGSQIAAAELVQG
jgi:glutamate dehydrogenase